MTQQQSINSTKALCQKLERTFYRRPDYGDYQVDWVFDIAVTAWHLADWVARERSAGNKTTLKIIQEELKKKCPELSVCEQVANGAKHFILCDAKLQPFNIASDVQGTEDLMGITKSFTAGEGPIDIILTPSVIINDKDGQPWQATMLFHRVLSFWKQELGLNA